MMTVFNIGVKGIIVQSGKVLLVKRMTNDGFFWEAPGGRIDDNESLDQTLLRELKEELPGIVNIRIGELLHAARIPGMPLGDRGLTLIWYAVDAEFPDGVRVSEEHESYKWHTITEVERLGYKDLTEAIKRHSAMLET